MKNASQHTSPLANRFGLCQWFHYLDFDAVRRTVSLLHGLGVRHLRTGISWADFHRPEGEAWYGWVFDTLKQAELELLVSVWHTPPSLSESGACSGPPKRLEDYSDFLQQVLILYGGAFNALELWNEPNNRIKWNFRDFDPRWEKFGRMVAFAAKHAKARGATTVLGGMIPVDHHWLNLLKAQQALEHIDVIAIHAFPGMWWNHEFCWEWEAHWRGWAEKLEYIRAHADGRPVWITETGLATWNAEQEAPGRFEEQALALEEVLQLHVPRIYWYSAIDLDPVRSCIEFEEDGRHDENEYHLGLMDFSGTKKPAYAILKEALRTPRASMPVPD